MEKRILVIVGSGPAGYTAAIYAARAGLRPLLFQGASSVPGGQLMTTTDVENYPGFDTISGPDLMECLKKQAMRFGTEIISEDVSSVKLSSNPFFVKGSGKTELYADSIIVASGATARRADIAGTKDGELWQKGVSACAVCDGAAPIFRDKEIAVIGGGDSAMEEALFLTKFASKVYIVHRRDKLRASKFMEERVKSNNKIEIIWNSVVTEAIGKELLSSVKIKDLKTNQEYNRDVAGLFFAIGHTPNSAFLNGQVELDENQYIKVKPGSTITNVPGLFAAGDVQDPRYRQAITAAGTGCMAALDVERWLMEKS